MAQQKLIRADRLEAGMFGTCIFQGDPEMFRGYAGPRNYQLADGFRKMASNDPLPLPFQLFLRYQVQTERLYRRAVDDWERLIKLRPFFAEAQNEAIFDPPPPPDPLRNYSPNEPISDTQPE